MKIKELVALLRFLEVQYGEDTEVCFDYQGEQIVLSGGFNIELS